LMNLLARTDPNFGSGLRVATLAVMRPIVSGVESQESGSE
jgi:hypothetical protein